MLSNAPLPSPIHLALGRCDWTRRRTEPHVLVLAARRAQAASQSRPRSRPEAKRELFPPSSAFLWSVQKNAKPVNTCRHLALALERADRGRPLTPSSHSSSYAAAELRQGARQAPSACQPKLKLTVSGSIYCARARAYLQWPQRVAERAISEARPRPTAASLCRRARGPAPLGSHSVTRETMRRMVIRRQASVGGRTGPAPRDRRAQLQAAVPGDSYQDSQ